MIDCHHFAGNLQYDSYLHFKHILAHMYTIQKYMCT